MFLLNMVESCILCSNEIIKDSLKFKKKDLTTNEIVVPQGMTEMDLICVNCFNSILEDPITNTRKARFNILLNIVRDEMQKKELDVDSLLDKLDEGMNQWSLSEANKVSYIEDVMKTVELDLHEEQSYMFSQIKRIKDIFRKTHVKLSDDVNSNNK